MGQGTRGSHLSIPTPTCSFGLAFLSFKSFSNILSVSAAAVLDDNTHDFHKSQSQSRCSAVPPLRLYATLLTFIFRLLGPGPKPPPRPPGPPPRGVTDASSLRQKAREQMQGM